MRGFWKRLKKYVQNNGARFEVQDVLKKTWDTVMRKFEDIAMSNRKVMVSCLLLIQRQMKQAFQLHIQYSDQNMTCYILGNLWSLSIFRVTYRRRVPKVCAIEYSTHLTTHARDAFNSFRLSFSVSSLLSQVLECIVN